METPTVESVWQLAVQLSADEQIELMHRLQAMQRPRQRPSQSLRVFNVDRFPEGMTLRRADEYGDDDR